MAWVQLSGVPSILPNRWTTWVKINGARGVRLMSGTSKRVRRLDGVFYNLRSLPPLTLRPQDEIQINIFILFSRRSRSRIDHPQARGQGQEQKSRGRDQVQGLWAKQWRRQGSEVGAHGSPPLPFLSFPFRLSFSFFYVFLRLPSFHSHVVSFPLFPIFRPRNPAVSFHIGVRAQPRT